MERSAGKNATNNIGLEPGLELWLAYPGDLEEPASEEACTAILNDAERGRASRFRFDRHRREYLTTHALARVALSHAHPLPPLEWRFSVNEHGKPSPVPECGVRFNQSNSVELTVCLAARPDQHSGAAAAEVGVDVESFARAEGIVPLAARVFSAAERAELEALPDSARPDRALSLWTLKEAYIKARGMGLSLPLDEISFLFDGPQAMRFQVEAGVDENPGRWRFCRFDHAGHRIALAVDAAAAGPLKVFEVRPPLGPPTRLAWSSPAWFPASPTAGIGRDG
jgi:4'-phosphopantetheinyl transferase